MAQINHFLEGPSYLSFTFQYDGRAYYGSFDRQARKFRAYNNSVVNDITFDRYPPMTIAARNDTFYAVVQPYSLVPSLKQWTAGKGSSLDSAANERLQHIVSVSKGLTELSNPIIMLFTFNRK